MNRSLVRYGMRWRLQTMATLLGLASLLLGTAVSPVVAETASAALDPVVVDVIEMLDSQVDEGVISYWLESTERRPADVGSQDVIALNEAGASKKLIAELLRRMKESKALIQAGKIRDTPSMESGGSIETVTKEGASDAPQRGNPETVIRLRAKRVWVDEDEPDRPRDPVWDIYLYLDGELVSWTRPTLQGEPVEVRRALEAGPHKMRVVLQRYEELRGGWAYESLAVPTFVAFEARSGGLLEIEVEMKRIWGLWRQRKDGGPLSYVIRQGGEVLAENDGTGGDPNRWQPICEDVEANFEGGDAVPKRFRNSMSRCIRWADLWTGSEEVTSRREILEFLAGHDFQPPMP